VEGGCLKCSDALCRPYKRREAERGWWETTSADRSDSIPVDQPSSYGNTPTLDVKMGNALNHTELVAAYQVIRNNGSFVSDQFGFFICDVS